MTKDEALKLALEALEEQIRMANGWQSPAEAKAIDAIKEALAQQALDRKAKNARELGLDYEPEKTVCPFCSSEWVTAEQHDRKMDRLEQESVAITITGKLGNIYSFTGDYSLKKGDKVYTTPPQRKPLTYEEIDELSRTMVKGNKSVNWLCRAIEAAHGIKGEA